MATNGIRTYARTNQSVFWNIGRGNPLTSDGFKGALNPNFLNLTTNREKNWL